MHGHLYVCLPREKPLHIYLIDRLFRIHIFQKPRQDPRPGLVDARQLCNAQVRYLLGTEHPNNNAKCKGRFKEHASVGSTCSGVIPIIRFPLCMRALILASFSLLGTAINSRNAFKPTPIFCSG
jgi:hypothetical protein